MNTRTLLVLLLLVLGLSAAAYYVSQTETGKQTDPKDEGGTLLSRLSGDPERIRLTNKDGVKHYVLESAARGWMIVDPVVDEAQESQVRMLLGQLAQAVPRIGWPDGEASAGRIQEAGLDEPMGRMVVESGSSKLSLEFGAECFPVGFRFAKVDGVVRRIPAGIEGIVEINPQDLINQQLFKTTPPGLQRLELRRRNADGGETGLILEKTRTGALTVRALADGSEAMPAAGAKVAGLVVALLSSRVQRFVRRAKLAPGTPAPKPWATIRVRGEFGEELVTLSDPAAGTVGVIKSYPKDESFPERPSRMLVDAQAFQDLIAEPIDALISTQVWSYGPAASSQIRIENATGGEKQPALVLKRNAQSGAFRLASPQVSAVDSRAVNSLIEALEQLRLVELVSPSDEAARAALAVPEFRIGLEAPPAKQSLGSIDIKLGVAKDGRVFLERKGDSVLWRIDAPQLDVLKREWWRYVEAVAFRFRAATRVVSSIEVASGNARAVWKPGEKGWSKDGELDEDFEEFVFDALRILKSKEVAGSPPQSLVAGLAPLATLRLVTGEGAKRKVLDEIAFYSEGAEGLLSVRKTELVVHRLFKRQARSLRRFFEAMRE